MKTAPSRRARRKMHIWPVAIGLVVLIALILVSDPLHKDYHKGLIDGVKLTSESDQRSENNDIP